MTVVLNASEDGGGGDDDAEQILYARMLEEVRMKRMTHEGPSDHLGAQEDTIQNRVVKAVGSKNPSFVVDLDAGEGVGGIAEDTLTP